MNQPVVCLMFTCARDVLSKFEQSTGYRSDMLAALFSLSRLGVTHITKSILLVQRAQTQDQRFLTNYYLEFDKDEGFALLRYYI